MTPLPQPSRRSFVKGAAWTAPVVVVAGAAPAFAASTAPLTLSSLSNFTSGTTTFTTVNDVNNPSNGKLTSTLTATIEVTTNGAWGTPTVSPRNTNTSGNWTYVGFTGSGNTLTFTFDATSEMGPGSATRFLDYDIAYGSSVRATSRTITLLPGNAAPVVSGPLTPTANRGAAARR